MATIRKKIWPEYFETVVSGKKKFELRLADFAVSCGDSLILEEWNPETKQYTGRTISKKVGYVFDLKSANLEKFWRKEEIEQHGLRVLSLE